MYNKGLLPNGFKIKDFGNEKIKKGKLLTRGCVIIGKDIKLRKSSLKL